MWDILFKNVAVADGTGAPLYRADVAVQDGKIESIGAGLEGAAHRVVTPPEGYILAPGFIDTHSHGDFHRFHDPLMKHSLLQGVTTEVCGNCGNSMSPVVPERFALLKKKMSASYEVEGLEEMWAGFTSVGKYMEAVEKQGVALNTYCLVGHNTVRVAAMGVEDRDPTPAELAHMCDLVRDAMRAGALGLSSGLIYIPGVYSKTEELVALCKAVGEYGGYYATHMRNESDRVVESVRESIEIARRSGCRLLISHHKVGGKHNVGLQKKTLQLIDEANAAGVEVLCDQYQYSYGATQLGALIPPRFHSDGPVRLLEKCADPAVRAQIVEGMLNDTSYENFFKQQGPEGVLIASCAVTHQYNGKHLDQISAEMGLPGAEAVCELMVRNSGTVLMCVRICEPEVVDEIFCYERTVCGSDGILVPEGSLTHPRTHGEFVHMFQTYVREKKLVSWEQAVRKCTGMSADFLRLRSKGYVQAGKDADLVLFDRDTIGTDGDYVHPLEKPRGVDMVLIGGRVLVDGGKIAE